MTSKFTSVGTSESHPIREDLSKTGRVKQNMKRIMCMCLIVAMTISLVRGGWGDVVLTMESAALYPGSTDNILNFSMNSILHRVAALQVDILFDGNCFTVTDVTKTSRTQAMDIFHSSHIRGGIRMAMTGIGIDHYIPKGTGPIAEITVDVGGNTFEEYVWDVTGAVAADPYGDEITVREVHGRVCVCYFDPVLAVSSTEFNLGDVWIGQSATDILTVINASEAPGWVDIIAQGCAAADPASFGLYGGSQRDVTVFCRPEEEGPCEGTLALYGGIGGEIKISVTCNGVIPDSAILSTVDRALFQHSENNRVALFLDNIVPLRALQTDVLFDTTCFEVTAVERTGRGGLDIFNWSYVDGGIRIVTIGVNNAIPEGYSTIIEIFANAADCPERSYPWDITNSIAADPVGTVVTVKEVDGIVLISSGVRGDVNDDGLIDVRDVVLGVGMITGRLPQPDLREAEAADCTRDGTVTVVDIMGIVNVILGTGTCPP